MPLVQKFRNRLRRMVETAAHLSDHVFPRLPVRQWVLSVPKRLRYFVQRDGAVLDSGGGQQRLSLSEILSTLRGRASPGTAERGGLSESLGLLALSDHSYRPGSVAWCSFRVVEFPIRIGRSLMTKPSAPFAPLALANSLQRNRLSRRQALWLLGASSVGASLVSLQGCAQSPVSGKTIVVGMSEAQERKISAPYRTRRSTSM